MKNMKLEFKMNGHACNYYTVYLLFMQMCCYLSFEQAKTRGIKFRSYWLVHIPEMGFFGNVLKLFFLNPIFPLINIV